MTIPNCRGADTELFYSFTTWPEAAVICRGCPIVAQCRLDFADDPYAFAGGMTPAQRSAWVRANAARKPSPVERRKPEFRKATTPEQRAEVVRIFDTELVGPEKIAGRVGLAKSTVQRILRQAGRKRTEEEVRELARRGARAGGQRAVKERNLAMLKKLLDENYTVAECSEMIGISWGHIYKLRKELNGS